MLEFGRKKIAAALAFASLFGSRASAINANKSEMKSPKTLTAVSGGTLDNKNTKIPNTAKVLLAFFGGMVVITSTAIVISKCFGKNNNGPQTPDEKAVESVKNITITKNKFLDDKNKKVVIANEKRTTDMENTQKFIKTDEKPKDKEMSDEEINVLLDKMLNILNSFGSRDQQFLSEYNKAIQNVSDEQQKENVYGNKLRDFRSRNKQKYYECIKVNCVLGECYDRDNFKWEVLRAIIDFFTNRLMSFKNDKSKINSYKAKFTYNSVKYNGGSYDWQLELNDNDNSLQIKEWRYNHGQKTFDIILTLCE